MTWKPWITFVAIASVALNVAFVAVWAGHVWAGRSPAEGNAEVAEPAVWCPLHRELQVTDAQWRAIEPRLRQFQGDVGALREETMTARSAVIDLIAAAETDVEAIAAKQEAILATKRQIQRLVVEHLLFEKTVLTPEQQERLFSLLRDRTGCSAEPPMSGPARDGMGCVLQNGQQATSQESSNEE